MEINFQALEQVQQARFRAWAPSEYQMREILSLCPRGLHVVSFKARLNFLSLLRSDTELIAAGLERFPVYVSMQWLGKQLLAQCLVCG